MRRGGGLRRICAPRARPELLGPNVRQCVGRGARATGSAIPTCASGSPAQPGSARSLPRMSRGVLRAQFSSGAGASGTPASSPVDVASALDTKARVVITDSGGLQEETTVLGVPCLTIRENTERPVTITHGTNRLVGIEPATLLDAVDEILAIDKAPITSAPELWDGKAAGRIVAVLEQALIAGAAS